MTRPPVGWDRVRDVFDRAISEPADRRLGVVAELAGSDGELRREVVELLERYDSEDPGFGAGFAALFDRPIDDSPSDWIGRSIGPYRVIRELGRGGMGAVFEAQRNDAEYEKRVAIKLIRPGMHSDAIVRRFRRERQILAALEHPNIARLLDGGVASDERPYLVMEYVDGRPIDRHCDELRLTIRARISLFIEICGAVEHAHRNLVVHRDLKPGNILVTDQGVPKLLDFGVAKLLHDARDTQVATATTTDGRFLTPEFASPEQLRDEPVTTVSDVYSLGLILYELLAGHQPFRAAARSPAGLNRILTTEPARPSATVTGEAASMRSEPDAPRLRRRLAGELDNIVLTAIRKEPSRRYASVQSFADDLRRYLDGKPVLAQKDTAVYRTRKFVGRHRAGVAAAMLVVLSLVGGMAATLWQGQRARMAFVRAEVERNKAEQVTAFLENMIGAGNRSWISLTTRPSAQTTVLEAVNQVAGSVGTELRGQPDAEATIRRTIGNTYQMMGMADSAEPHLRAALALRRRIAPAPNLDLARDLGGLAATRVYKGDFREAEVLLREALTIHSLIGDTSSIHFSVATNDLSVVLARSGDFAAAEPLALRALALNRALFGDSSPSVAMALNNLAFFSNSRGDLESAAGYVRESLAIYERVENRELPERGPALFNLGLFHKWLGRYGEADSLFREAALVFTRTSPRHQYLMLTSIERAYAHYLSGSLGAAEAALMQAEQFAEANRTSGTHPDMARLATVRGLVLIARGRAAQAEPALRRALDVRESAHGRFDNRTMETMGVLGLSLSKMGRLDEAAPLLATAHMQLVKRFGPRDPRTLLAERWRHEGSATSPTSK